VGVGLRARHYRRFLDERPALPWLEVHTENFLDPGGWDAHVLGRLRQDYPISLHGVGLGLGSREGFSEAHLERVKAAAERIEPCFISEHLCWTSTASARLPDLLPLALDASMLRLVSERIERVQARLGRRLLIENVSAYVRFEGDAMSEAEFLAELVRRTGCGVLLDLNNLYVNQCNQGEDALAALAALPPGSVGEMHLAGHLDTAKGLIDHHGAAVAPEVWNLYRAALRRFGPVPTLIEWDTDVPELEVLLREAAHAGSLMDEVCLGGGDGPGLVPDAVALAAAAPSVHAAAAAAAAGGTAHAATRSASHEGEKGIAPAIRLPAHRQLQELFAQAALGAEGEAPLLASLRGGMVHDRLAVYRGNTGAAWERALAAAYPVLRQLVGEEFFAALARAYGRAVPMDDPDLNQFGARMAGFLKDFEPVAPYPYFCDMARLEWLLHRAYYAPAPARLDHEALGRLQPAQLDGLVLSLHPTAALFRSDWQVIALWRAHQAHPHLPFPDELAQAEQGVVARPGWHPQAVPLPPGDWSLLSAVQQGEPFGAAIEQALEADPAFDLGACLTRCLDLGLLSRPEQA
jgi:hypothetical protein